MENTSKGKGKGRKIGRNKNKCKRYRDMHTLEKNKVRRVLRSNGAEYATEWAATRGVLGYLKQMMKV